MWNVCWGELQVLREASLRDKPIDVTGSKAIGHWCPRLLESTSCHHVTQMRYRKLQDLTIFFSALNLWFGLALNQFFLANLLFLFWYESVYMQLYVGSMQISFRLLWRLMAKSLLWVSEETLYFWSSAGVLKILETFKAEQNVFSIMR